MLGETLARSLRVNVGDQLHATTQTADGNSEQVFLEVAGLYRTGTPTLDKSRIYMHIADLQRFVRVPDRVHEIAIVAASAEAAPALARQLGAAIGNDQILVRSWGKIRPDIQTMIDMTTMSTSVMIFIILFVATLGVVNTMLMAVFERTRELGMLKAIGMSGTRIVGLIVTETLFMVLVSAAIGTLFGLALDVYMVKEGVDLRSFTGGVSFGGVGINPVLHGAISARGLILPSLILATTCFFASFYPALRAARLRPAVGMRET